MSETTNTPAATQEQVTELEARVQTLEASNTALNEANESLTAANETLATEKQALAEENEKLKLELEEAKVANELLAEDLAAAKTAPAPKEEAEKPTFEYGGSTYEVRVPDCHIAGKGKVTAADIAGDTELQRILVESGSGFVKAKV